MTDEQHDSDDPAPPDGLPAPSKWRTRMGMAGVASLGGVVAWIFGRRDKPPEG